VESGSVQATADPPTVPRLFIAARDFYPPFRVDITELFGVFLVRRFDLTWLMRRSDYGPAAVIETAPHERFVVPRREPGRLSGIRSRLSYMAAAWAQAFHAAAGRWDLVQVRDIPIGSLWFFLAARIARRPFVYWMSFPVLEAYLDRARHPADGDSPLLTLYRRAYHALGRIVQYRIVLRGADHVFVQSQIMRREVMERGVDGTKVTPVPMAVNVERYNPGTVPPARDGRLAGRKVLVYVGSLEPQRQPVMLIEALAAVLQEEQSALLVFVGARDPETAESMTARAEELGVADHILYTGHLPLADALSYVARADVCLALYPVTDLLVSGTPTKLVEYLAMGRPVVGNAHPYQSEVIAETGAGVVAEMNAAAFARAILSILSEGGAAIARAAAAPAWVRANLSYDVTATRVGDVYARLVAERRR